LLSRFQPEVLQGKAPFDVERFAELHLESLTGVEFDLTPELPHGIDGVTNTEKLRVNVELAEIPTNFRYYRSTLAHELGHAFIHTPVLRKRKENEEFTEAKDQGPALYRAATVPLYRNPEWQAWHFAGALLMPKEALLIKLKECRMDLNAVADFFQVNSSFVSSRLKKVQR
jgi:hypothetical protein